MKAHVIGMALLVSLPVCADPIDNPWALVPAMPTACYKAQDNLDETITARLATLDDAISTQSALNDEANGQMTGMAAEDPWAMADRMAQYMMDHPGEGIEKMQAMAATGQTLSGDVTTQSEWELAHGKKLDDLVANYRAAFAAFMTTVDAKLEALPTGVVGESRDAWTEEAYALMPAIAKQANTDYEALCTHWWKPAGPFASWLTEFRSHLVDERIPTEQDVSDRTRDQLEMHGIDTIEVRSTATMDAARDYLDNMKTIYTERQARPMGPFVDEHGEKRFDFVGKY